ALVYKMVAREDSDGVMQPVAKKSQSKSTVGGRKYAGRLYDEEGYAYEELLVTASTRKAAEEELTKQKARPLQIPLVVDGEIRSELWSIDALKQARDHHLKS
ncbi:hypothetical protein QP091_08955, partial [Aerococcus urinae]